MDLGNLLKRRRSHNRMFFNWLLLRVYNWPHHQKTLNSRKNKISLTLEILVHLDKKNLSKNNRNLEDLVILVTSQILGKVNLNSSRLNSRGSEIFQTLITLDRDSNKLNKSSSFSSNSSLA